MSLESNIAARKSAETIAELVVDTIAELKAAHGMPAVKVFFAVIRDVFAEELTVEPKPAATPERVRESTGDDDADATLEEIEAALELVDDLPDRAQEFGESVSEKLRAIAETIERTGEVTERQQTAIDNMSAGIRKWMRD